MKADQYNCERHCTANQNNRKTQFIVLTGGPGAGKTAVLEYLRKILCKHVAILPEAASILFKGGFWRLESDTAKMAAQRAIYHVQDELQSMVDCESHWSVGLCDRGTLDGLAYWPAQESAFFKTLNTNLEKEYAKYSSVIHLRTPSLKKGYNHINPFRTESPAAAVKIDKRIHEIWKGHKNYYYIESTDSFLEKIDGTTRLIFKLIPDDCRKNLVKANL